MRSFLRLFSGGLLLSLWALTVRAQHSPPLEVSERGATVYLSKDSVARVRFITLVQFWARQTRMNPGSLYKNGPADQVTDLSLRRGSLVTIIQPNPRLLMLFNYGGYANAANEGEVSFELTDAYAEYKIRNGLFVGAGLSQWSGLSRITVEGVSSLINVDVPTVAQPTFNRLDRVGRSLGIFAKGRLGSLNYRLMLSDPFVPPATSFAANAGRGSPSGSSVGESLGPAQPGVAYLNPQARSLLMQGYGQWEFLDHEANVSPYVPSTYFGTKRIFNLGAGFMYRSDAMLEALTTGLALPGQAESAVNPRLIQTARTHDFFAFAVDAFLNYRFNAKQEGITAYLGYFNLNFGPNYFTVRGNNNIASGSTAGVSAINGIGNAMPATGTGQTGYGQLGYLAPLGFLHSTHRFGLFTTYQYSQFKALKDPTIVYEGGANWFLAGNNLKLTGQYRNRPIYRGLATASSETNTAVVDSRRGEWILQLQMTF